MDLRPCRSLLTLHKPKVVLSDQSEYRLGQTGQCAGLSSWGDATCQATESVVWAPVSHVPIQKVHTWTTRTQGSTDSNEGALVAPRSLRPRQLAPHPCLTLVAAGLRVLTRSSGRLSCRRHAGTRGRRLCGSAEPAPGRQRLLRSSARPAPPFIPAGGASLGPSDICIRAARLPWCPCRCGAAGDPRLKLRKDSMQGGYRGDTGRRRGFQVPSARGFSQKDSQKEFPKGGSSSCTLCLPFPLHRSPALPPGNHLLQGVSKSMHERPRDRADPRKAAQQVHRCFPTHKHTHLQGGEAPLQSAWAPACPWLPRKHSSLPTYTEGI